MNHRSIAVFLFPLLAVACADDSGLDAASESRDGDVIGVLDLESGIRVVFLDEDPDPEVVALGIMELLPREGAETPAAMMKARGASPLELWLALADPELDETPVELVEDHDLRFARELVELQVAPEHHSIHETRFRDSWPDKLVWGGGDDYCAKDWNTDFEVWAPEPVKTSSGKVPTQNGEAGATWVYLEQTDDVWASNCNGGIPANAWAARDTFMLRRWDGFNWVGPPLNCGSACDSEETHARAMHYLSSQVHDWKIGSGRAQNAGAEPGPTSVMATSPTGTGSYCDPHDEEPAHADCQQYCWSWAEMCPGEDWGENPPPFSNFDECLDECRCNFQTDTTWGGDIGFNSANCRTFIFWMTGFDCQWLNPDPEANWGWCGSNQVAP